MTIEEKFKLAATQMHLEPTEEIGIMGRNVAPCKQVIERGNDKKMVTQIIVGGGDESDVERLTKRLKASVLLDGKRPYQ